MDAPALRQPAGGKPPRPTNHRPRLADEPAHHFESEAAGRSRQASTIRASPGPPSSRSFLRVCRPPLVDLLDARRRLGVCASPGRGCGGVGRRRMGTACGGVRGGGARGPLLAGPPDRVPGRFPGLQEFQVPGRGAQEFQVPGRGAQEFRVPGHARTPSLNQGLLCRWSAMVAFLIIEYAGPFTDESRNAAPATPPPLPPAERRSACCWQAMPAHANSVTSSLLSAAEIPRCRLNE